MDGWPCRRRCSVGAPHTPRGRGERGARTMDASRQTHAQARTSQPPCPPKSSRRTRGQNQSAQCRRRAASYCSLSSRRESRRHSASARAARQSSPWRCSAHLRWAQLRVMPPRHPQADRPATAGYWAPRSTPCRGCPASRPHIRGAGHARRASHIARARAPLRRCVMPSHCSRALDGGTA